ncbi:hypothetical protein Z517_09455 [Fonsecaea pedrosoi CBS 271.37]|uniref:Uncharacterized protein n=1 Tax=Fonsecaea pedrosoi CBS 271.37 TaxID=1442368 RepID=A0A0D2GEJ7_9EURO|nr:uncharacterized protein Z517_09455 [Fonsecaea pedrosoi CBS 271.37]KIW77010.1 hypothetical protein Z517_09455 [Fonsecaea pedrosoi CBS 271.37]
MDYNVRHTPQDHPTDPAPSTRTAKKPQRRRVRFTSGPQAGITTQRNGQTQSPVRVEPEVSHVQPLQPPNTHTADFSAQPSEALNVFTQNMSPCQAENCCIHCAPEAVVVSPRNPGNARRLYTIVRNHADHTQQPYSSPFGCTAQPQQPYITAAVHAIHASVPLGFEPPGQTQQADSGAHGYAARSSVSSAMIPQHTPWAQQPCGMSPEYAVQALQGQSQTMTPRYTDQYQHLYTSPPGPPNSNHVQQPHVVPQGNLDHSQQSYDMSTETRGRPQYHTSAQGRFVETRQAVPSTPTLGTQWTTVPISQPQQTFTSVSGVSGSHGVSLPNDQVQSPESQRPPDLRTWQRKRPAEDPITAGSGGPPAAKRQQQGYIPPEGSQQAPRTDQRLAMSCMRAFRSLDTKFQDLHQAYCDKRDRDKWELSKREQEFKRRQPSMRGEYQHALESVRQDHEKQRRYWKGELRTNEQRWKGIVQQEDKIWRSSYAELDKIWDTWVQGDFQDLVRPQFVQYIRHLESAVSRLGSKPSGHVPLQREAPSERQPAARTTTTASRSPRPPDAAPVMPLPTRSPSAEFTVPPPAQPSSAEMAMPSPSSPSSIASTVSSSPTYSSTPASTPPSSHIPSIGPIGPSPVYVSNNVARAMLPPPHRDVASTRPASMYSPETAIAMPPRLYPPNTTSSVPPLAHPPISAAAMPPPAPYPATQSTIPPLPYHPSPAMSPPMRPSATTTTMPPPPLPTRPAIVSPPPLPNIVLPPTPPPDPTTTLLAPLCPDIVTAMPPSPPPNRTATTPPPLLPDIGLARPSLPHPNRTRPLPLPRHPSIVTVKPPSRFPHRPATIPSGAEFRHAEVWGAKTMPAQPHLHEATIIPPGLYSDSVRACQEPDYYRPLTIPPQQHPYTAMTMSLKPQPLRTMAMPLQTQSGPPSVIPHKSQFRRLQESKPRPPSAMAMPPQTQPRILTVVPPKGQLRGLRGVSSVSPSPSPSLSPSLSPPPKPPPRRLTLPAEMEMDMGAGNGQVGGKGKGKAKDKGKGKERAMTPRENLARGPRRQLPGNMNLDGDDDDDDSYLTRITCAGY